jgi:hypothetical protein
MKRSFAFAIAALSLAVSIPAGAAEIFRCSTPSGSMAYQQFPCDPNNDAGRIDVPTMYPDVDVAARERLLRRAELADQRLEAQRERLSREEMTRVMARAQVDSAKAMAEAAAAANASSGMIVLGRAVQHRRHARMGGRAAIR